MARGVKYRAPPGLFLLFFALKSLAPIPVFTSQSNTAAPPPAGTSAFQPAVRRKYKEEDRLPPGTVRRCCTDLFSVCWVPCWFSHVASLGPHGLWPTSLLCPWDSPARTLEWAAMPSSGDLSDPAIELVSCMSPSLAGGIFFLPLASSGKPLSLHFLDQILDLWLHLAG